MKTDPANTWLSGNAQAEEYVSSADVIIVERERTTKLLLDLFGYHFGGAAGLRVLDLGCGDGALAERLRARHPGHAYVLMDGSRAMLDKARQRLPGDDVTFVRQTFEEYVDRAPEDQVYDCVFSSNAIHHLDWLGKGRMFAHVYRELEHGGLFVNIDPVQPSSERSERWQFHMWVDWVNETLRRRGREDDVGTYDDLPATYKAKPENKPSSLPDQLELLRRIGFRDVDCIYKYGIFAMFAGVK